MIDNEINNIDQFANSLAECEKLCSKISRSLDKIDDKILEEYFLDTKYYSNRTDLVFIYSFARRLKEIDKKYELVKEQIIKDVDRSGDILPDPW